MFTKLVLSGTMCPAPTLGDAGWWPGHLNPWWHESVCVVFLIKSWTHWELEELKDWCFWAFRLCVLVLNSIPVYTRSPLCFSLWTTVPFQWCNLVPQFSEITVTIMHPRCPKTHYTRQEPFLFPVYVGFCRGIFYSLICLERGLLNILKYSSIWKVT